MKKQTDLLINQLNFLSNAEPLSEGIIYTPQASDQEIEEFLQEWRAAKGVALDIETYGEKENHGLDPWLGRIRTIQIGLRSGKVLIADLGGWNDDRVIFAARLQRLGFFITLRESLRNKTQWKIGHFISFDLQWLYKCFGYDAWCCGDTMILSQLYWAGVEPYRHSLKAVAARLGIEVDKEQQRSNWGFTLTNEQLNYAANDVRYTFQLFDRLYPMCLKLGMRRSVEIEFNAVPAFAEMGIDGFPVDLQTLEHLINEYSIAEEHISGEFNRVFPDLSPADNRKLPSAIKNRLGIDVWKSDKDALNPHRHNPVISSLLASRSIGISLDYLHGMQAAYRDGAVRGGYSQNAPQGRGRSTSGKSKGVPSVNLQNPPNPTKACPEVVALNLPPVRSAFRPVPGDKLIIVDLSAAHARIAAQTTQDPLFIASYNQGVDVHAIVASKISVLAGRKWTKEDIGTIRKQDSDEGRLATTLRNISKNVFYCWLNGGGAGKISQTIIIGGYDCSFDFAREIIDLLGEAFPGIKVYHDRVKRSLKRQQVWFSGCSMPYSWASGISGRRVYLPVWPKTPDGFGGAKPTDALMVAWMTVESDAVKNACHLVRVARYEHPEWGLKLVNVCHDEVDCICHEEFADQAAAAVWEAMNGSLGLFVTSIPAYEKEFDPKDVICSAWDEK